MIKRLIVYFVIITFILFTSVNGLNNLYNITPDEITETSIVWNISAIINVSSINYIAFDGITISGYLPNTTRITQGNLYHDETHTITVINASNIKYEGSAKTLSSPAISFMTAYTFLFFVIIFLVVGAFVPFVSIGAFIFCIFGLINSVGNSFLMGVLFFVLLIASIVELRYG